MKIDQAFLPADAQDPYSIRFLNRPFLIPVRTAFLSIMLVSILLRLASAFYLGNNVVDLPGINDQISYDGLARRVIDGHGFSYAEGHWPATRAGEPTAHWSFLYTLYLALVYKLFGINPLIARLIQALITGIFHTVLAWRIGARLFNRNVGVIAAIVSAFYIYFFYYAGALMTEAFYITGILWVFDVSLRIVAERSNPQADLRKLNWFQWTELGFAIGVTVLLRQVFLLFLPFLLLWLWWCDQGNSKNRWQMRWSALRGFLVVVLILALLITPWTIRNYLVFDTFVLLNTNAGFAFYWGNHPIHGTSFVPLLGESYQNLIPPELLVLNEGKLDKALLREGIKIVADDPVRYLLLSASRIEEYIKFWPSTESGIVSNISRVGSFGLLLPFMLFGIWVSLSIFRNSADPRQRANLLIFYVFIVVYTTIHLLTWTLIRYRLPVDAVLILFSAIGIEYLIRKPNHILYIH